MKRKNENSAHGKHQELVTGKKEKKVGKLLPSIGQNE